MLNFHKKIFSIFGLKYSKLKDSLASENDLKIKRKMDLWIDPLKLRRSLELRCNTDPNSPLPLPPPPTHQWPHPHQKFSSSYNLFCRLDIRLKFNQILNFLSRISLETEIKKGFFKEVQLY